MVRVAPFFLTHGVFTSLYKALVEFKFPHAKRNEMAILCTVQPIEHCEMQNNAVDIYNTFFTDCPQLITSDYEKPEVKIVCTFK